MNKSDLTENVENAGKESSALSENHKDLFLSTLEQYENRQAPMERLCQTMARHFNKADVLDRQELVVHLFSADPVIQSFMAANFARFNETRRNITEFDEGAREKSLIMARNHIKMGEFSLITAPNWLSTIGYLGQSRDISLLVDWCKKICEGEMKDSARIQKTSILSISRLLQRYPESIQAVDQKALAKILIQGIDSQSGRVQKMSMDLLLKQSRNQNFTEAFVSLLSGLPRTNRTARFLGAISGRITGVDESNDDFIGLILERSLDDADDQFVTGVLREITAPFAENPDAGNEELINKLTDLLEEYFETFLYTKKDKNQFKNMGQKEKFDRMIKFFHPLYVSTGDKRG